MEGRGRLLVSMALNLSELKENVLYDCEVNNELLQVVTVSKNTHENDEVNAIEETSSVIKEAGAMGANCVVEGAIVMDQVDFIETTEETTIEEVDMSEVVLMDRAIIITDEKLLKPDKEKECEGEGLTNSEDEDDNLTTEETLENSSKNEEPSTSVIHEQLDEDHNNNNNLESEHDDDLEETNINSTLQNQTRKRRGTAAPEEWKKNKNKRQRMLGEEYMGYTRKYNKDMPTVKRPSRSLKPGCSSSYCTKSKTRQCNLFTEIQRREIFNTFWNTTWEEKRMYVLNLVSYLPKKRSYVEGPSRREGSYSYHLRLDQDRLQVCKKMFLGTLGLNEKMVHYWIKSGKCHGLVESGDNKNKKKTEKRRTSSIAKELEERKKHLNMFLENLPKLESHYCRKDTQRQYFEYPFQTKTEIYNVYKEKCIEDNKTPLSMFTFDTIFKEKNLSIFKPRKDQCDTCCQWKSKQLTIEEYQKHIEKKNLAQAEKVADKEKAKNGEIHCFTMDVQAVKLCPTLLASSLYYKRRLQLHNFTIYNLATHHCMNYIWNESEGDLQASTFTTCILWHLQTFCLSDQKPVILFSDGCGYQNRNNILSNALSNFSMQNNITIEQKFLEKGHTRMECDSSHALIERKLKGREIHLPSEYITVIREARKKPFPLEVKYLTHDFFINYGDKGLMRFESIRPGKMKNDPTVSDLRALRYTDDGQIFYKTDLHREYQALPQRQKKQTTTVPKKLHANRLPVPIGKWNHLQELKNVLPEETHHFYDNLPKV